MKYCERYICAENLDIIARRHILYNKKTKSKMRYRNTNGANKFESRLRCLIGNSVRDALNEAGKPRHGSRTVKGDIGPYMRDKDTVKGKYLRYSPEDSGFNSEDEWSRSENFNEGEFLGLIGDAVDSLSKARDFARENGDGKWYMLLNAIVAELWDRTNAG